MNLSFSFSPAYLLLILPLAAGLTWLMYRGTKDLLPRAPRIFLSVFRFVVLSLLGILLLQPLLNSLQKISFAPIVAVLQDTSESLVIQKDSTFVREQYPGLLREFLGEFDPNEYTVDVYGFASDLDKNFQTDSLYFDRTGTNISEAVKSVQELYQNQNLGAIVIVGDGIATAGVNPLYAIEGTRQAVYTVLLGDTTSQKDIRIKEVLFNEIAYLKNQMPIRVKIQSQGFDQAPLKVSIRNTEKVLATQNLTLGRNQPEGEISFLLTPDQPGLQQFTIQVSRLNNEITYRNNSRRIFVNVLETRVKIALFGGSPHPDVGALRKAFDKDESYELSEFILKSPGTFYEDPGRYNLEDFDLFILHNFPQSGRDEAILSRILTQVKDNKKPIMHFVGIFTDLRALSPMYEYMALTPRSFTTKSEEVIVNFDRDYRQHSTYTFSDSWLQWVNASPPIYRNQSNWQAKSTAEIFATSKIKNIALDYPVFALQSHLGRKNMVFLGENFWRMRAHSYLETEDFENFDGWLFNNIKWLMVADDKRKFKVQPSKRVFSGNEAIIFKGQVYDDSYNPVSNVDIKLSLSSPDGKVSDYYLNETGQAQYFLELNNLEEGTYNYVAEGKKNEVSVGNDRGQFSIGKSSVEHFSLQADKDLMQQIALRTGGEFTYASDIVQLASNIQSLPGLKPTSEFKRNKVSFHEFKWIMILLLLMLSVEWVVRKLYSML
ncbi:MAG: hypothetical protein AAF587_29815 [Bacteroidota bacterium]